MGPVIVGGGHFRRRGREVGEVFSEGRTEQMATSECKKSLLQVDCVGPVAGGIELAVQTHREQLLKQLEHRHCLPLIH